MKKYLRIFAFTLAAAFVFAACDSSGGGEEQQPEPVSYSGRTEDDKLVNLTLTAGGAARKTSGGQRVPSGFTGGGTYTLHVDDVLASSGKFSTSGGGDTLKFTSKDGNTFTATAVGNTPPVFDAPITLDREIGGSASLAPPQMCNDGLFEMEVYEPDGRTLYEGGDVTIYGWIDEPDDRTGSNAFGEIGKIKDGKLTLNLKVPKQPQLFLEDGAYTGSLRFADSDTDSRNVISLGFQAAGEKTGFEIMYASQDLSYKGVVWAEKGWNYGIRVVEGNEWHSDNHPLQWYPTNDYKWIYNANPLPGTWVTDTGELIFNDDKTYSWKQSGDDWEGSYFSEGDFEKTADTITFKQTHFNQNPLPETWTQGYAIRGNSITLKERPNWNYGTYMRQ